jgi:hypothetical protein
MISATVEGYPKNEKAINLLRSENFKIVPDKADNDGNDLFRWSP